MAIAHRRILSTSCLIHCCPSTSRTSRRRTRGEFSFSYTLAFSTVRCPRLKFTETHHFPPRHTFTFFPNASSHLADELDVGNGTSSSEIRKVLDISPDTFASGRKPLASFESVSDYGDDDSSTDVIIVGAGVAGSALAYSLAKDGWRVHVFERDLSERDRIMGELLQPGGYLKLHELGLEDCVNGIDAQPVVGYALFMDGKPINLSVKLEEGTVVSLIQEKGIIRGVQYQTKAGQKLNAFAPLTVVCDGCFSKFRSFLCKSRVSVPSSFVGLILETSELPFANYGHVILADPSPILFYPISSTEVRCLVDVPGQKVPSIGNGRMAQYLKTIVAPQIPSELYSAFISAVDKGSIKTMPNRSMPADPYHTPGGLVLGDAFNMRHPLTGGGMTVALSDIAVLRELLKSARDLTDSSALCKYLESFYTLRKPMASTINTLADALYKVFCASPDGARQELRRACFEYNKPWRCLYGWTCWFVVWVKSAASELGSPFLCCCSLWCWPPLVSFSFTKTLVAWGKSDLGSVSDNISYPQGRRAKANVHAYHRACLSQSKTGKINIVVMK